MPKVSYEKKDKIYRVKNTKNNIQKKVAFLIIPSFIITLVGIFYIMLSVSLGGSNDKILYDETGNIDYKVYLKENNYYDSKFLGKDMQYIASLINTINADFNYKIHTTDKMKFNYKYKIIGTLRITDKSERNKVLYTKDYVLKEETKDLIESDNFEISEDVDIDYDKYNNYANAFRRDYSLTSNAELVLKMIVNVDGEYEGLEDKINKANNLEMTIPLSEQTIDITMNANKINQKGSLKMDEAFKVNNPILLLSGIILLIPGIGGFIVAIYQYVKRYSNNPYEKALHKILKNYDTYIVKATSDFHENEEPIRVSSFTELIDAQQIEKTPILFYEVEPGKKAYFVLKGNKEIYRFTLTKAYQNKLMKKNQKGEF